MLYQASLGVRSKFFVLILLVFLVTSLRANLITSGCSATNTFCSHAELTGSGSIVVNTISFDSWAIKDFPSTATNPSPIEVLVLDDQPSGFGFLFNTNG
jgi:hypothetical protein